MAAPKTFDAADARRVDKQYGAPALVEQRRRTIAALAPVAGERILDLGCGPGYLTLELAARVGGTGRAVGIDTSAPMLDVARARCVGCEQVEFRHADALALPFADASFDAVAAVQICLFVRDLERAFAELARVLKPGARAVIVDTDWDSLVWHTSDTARMARFLEIWKQRYVDAIVARRLPGSIRRAGLVVEHADAIPLVELAPDEASYSGSQLVEMAKYVGGQPGSSPQEATDWQADIRSIADRGEYFFALNRFLFVARKPD